MWGMRMQDGPLKPCDFGGTTALVALRIGEVCALLPCPVALCLVGVGMESYSILCWPCACAPASEGK